jgi:hypothetical protein
LLALNVSSRWPAAVVAASPPSFQPAYARITTGSRKSIGKWNLSGPAAVTAENLAYALSARNVGSTSCKRSAQRAEGERRWVARLCRAGPR